MQCCVGSLGLAVSFLLALSPGGVGAHEADGHPARIQNGSCDALSGVAFTLTGVGATVSPEGTPIPEPEMVGASGASAVSTSQTVLESSLTDLTENPYAIVVYESDEAMDHIIACGNVGGPLTTQMAGMVMPGDELAIWLDAAEDSGSAGLALLQTNGNQATLRIYLATSEKGEAHHDEAGQAAATPGAG